LGFAVERLAIHGRLILEPKETQQIQSYIHYTQSKQTTRNWICNWSVQ